MPKYGVEFVGTYRGTATVEARDKGDAEDVFEALVEEWGEEYLNQWIERQEFDFEAFEKEGY